MIPRCRLGLSQHPAIRLVTVCVLNVVVTALEFMYATVLYVETTGSSARSLQWRGWLKTLWL
jgi:hypothetical protein